MKRLQLFSGVGTDPHYNLAVEQYLLESLEDDCCTLYLWQNQNTVVIGQNQNAWKECRTTLLEQEGGKLARRLSGGGAVFHDLGNLNFTFLVSKADYDLDRQLDVIFRACRMLGIPAEKSGRNDLLADGRKFSGNAFYHNQDRSYHHGTLLVQVDMERMSRYLNPSKAKLEAKGVDSVRSRVVNLTELRPDLSTNLLQKALADAFGDVYGLPVQKMEPSELDETAVRQLYRRYRSWEWNFGRKLPFNFSCSQRFPWGELTLELQVESGVVQSASVYTDSMDWTVSPRLKEVLTGRRFTLPDLSDGVRSCGIPQADDVCRMLKDQNI